MNNIDKWAAKQYGVELRKGSQVGYHYEDDEWFTYNRRSYSFVWTITDPRCMNIVLRSIMENGSYWCTGYSLIRLSDGYRFLLYKAYETIEGHGKTPEDAQIACITAIWKTKDEYK